MRSQGAYLINGICLPAACSHEKAVRFLNSFMPIADLFAVGAQCRTGDAETFEAIDSIAM